VNPISRRTLITGSAAFGLISSPVINSEFPKALADTTSPSSASTLGERYFDHLYATTEDHSRSAEGPPPPDATPPPDRMARILHFNDTKGLRWMEHIDKEELPSFDDEAVISMEITGFRPGEGDKSRLAKSQFSQLHVSCNRVVGSLFFGPIAWAALATISTNKISKVPVQSLDWQNIGWGKLPSANSDQKSKLNYALLNHGAGKMSLTLTSTPKESALDKVLISTIKVTQIVAPLMSFPGICLPALQAFYKTFSAWEQARAENFLLASGGLDVAVTKQGLESGLISRNATPLLTGDYILFPEVYKSEMDSNLSRLTVEKGFLVEKNATGDPEDLKRSAVRDVSYVSLSIKVQPASEFPGLLTVADPLLDKEPAASSTGDKAKTKSKEP
jgi:hypothetical protein